jgi:ankyrin repeat protein
MEKVKSKKLLEKCLYEFSLQGKLEFIELLVKNGVDVNARLRHGYTPLFAAVIRSKKLAIRKLLKLGADINTKDKYGETAIYLSVRFLDFDTLELLYKSGADLKIRNNKGGDILDIAHYLLAIDEHRGSDDQEKGKKMIELIRKYI